MKAEIGDLEREVAGASDSIVMILTCPECATSYFVDDSRISPAGRTVKCSNCGARWTARAEAAAEAHEAPPAQPDSEPELAPAADPPVHERIAEVSEPEPEPEPAAAAPVVTIKPTREPRRAAGGKVLVWVGAAVVIAGLVAAAVAFRTQVVQFLPGSRAAYAGLGMEVSNLVIEDVHAEPTFQGGRPVLEVTGRIRNQRDAASSAPALRVSLLDHAGKPLAVKVARPIDGEMPARAVRNFAIAIVDPPAGVQDLEVTFELAGGRGSAQGPARADEASLAGAEPLEARPLPAGSPDALPPHD
jgi:predicted Zn finger-like uncharacterized protein